MSGHHRCQPPLAGRGLLSLASLMVSPEGRVAWRRQRDADLQSLWILAERGELPGNRSAFLTWWCGDVLENAFIMCCRGLDPRRWIRGPAFLMAATALDRKSVV